MGIVSNAMLILSGVYLALGSLYLRFWLDKRSRRDYLAFSLFALSITLVAWFELGALHSQTPEEYLFYAWWNFLIGVLVTLSLAWFAYVYLRGRRWLFWTYCAFRLLGVVVHLILSNGINFREITSVGRVNVFGEALSYPIAVPNGWMILPHLSHILLLVFCIDASIRTWQRGERRRALVFGTGVVLSRAIASIVSIGVLWGSLHLPFFASFSIIFVIAATLYELNYDMHRAAMLAEKLEERDARLTETLDQLQLSAAAANVGFWTRKVGEGMVWLSEKAGDVWGFPSEMQVNVDDVFQNIHPADREPYMTNIREVEEWKNEYQIEYRFLSSDGDVRWIHSRGKVEVIDGSRIIRGAIVDITKLKMAEARLIETLEQLQLSASAANVGMWTSKIDEEEIWASEKAGEILGLRLGEEITRKDLFQHIHPSDHSLFFNTARELEEGKNEFQIEYRIMLKDGNVRWVHSRGKVEEVDGSRVIRGAVVDITKLKTAEGIVRELSHKLINAQEKERARLARELHDDLSQSIALLSVQLTILHNEPRDLEYVQDQLKQYISDLGRLSGDVRRISHELHPAILSQLGLEASLHNFCVDLAAAHSLEIDFEADELSGKLPEDVSLCLYRVTQESLQNVIKHSAATSAHVRIKSENAAICLSVSDNGNGFDPEAAKEKEALGLLSIDERVRAVKGQAKIISAVGEGTKIEVRIPVGPVSDEFSQN